MNIILINSSKDCIPNNVTYLKFGDNFDKFIEGYISNNITHFNIVTTKYIPKNVTH
uniref:FNIp repeat-containing protein n=1 Tax=Borely moumouvirus TaxID=2712067 RepID=A0A6G6AC15_9VIRU